MLKTIGVAVAAATLSANAMAWSLFGEDKLTIVSPSSKASPTTVFAMGLKKSVGADYYQGANCEDAVRAYNEKEDAVFVYNSSMEFGARNKGLSCPMEGTVDNTYFVGATPVWICRANGSTADLVEGQTNSLGMASMYATKAHEARMREAGAGDLTIVPYSGSKTVVNALRAGDISLGWIGSGLAKKQVAAGNMECLYSTDPAADNYIGKTLPGLKVPDFTIGYVVYTNTKNDTLKEKLKAWANDPEFKAYMEKSLVTGTFAPTQADLDHMAAKVDRMSNNWIDKK